MSFDLVDIGCRAVRCEEARQEADALKKRRAEIQCIHEDDPNCINPCWKRYVPWGPDDERRLPETEWCQPCRDRERAHEKYLRAAQRLGSLRGSLTRMCRTAMTEEPTP
ncbi:hypothetical protein LCGC14_1533620 [marine sediment metagenome]|uniref:Uncharacterized protein n=1 Tax=marine sediment metagenome TaxID=412755 RepID=A0A0F9LVY1_9ZZZZ